MNLIKLIAVISLFLIFSDSSIFAARTRMSRNGKKAEKAKKTLQENSIEFNISASENPLNSSQSINEEFEQDESPNLKLIRKRLNEINQIIQRKEEDIDKLENSKETKVNIDKLEMLWMAYLAEDKNSVYTDNGINKEKFMEEVISWLGVPYQIGNNTKEGIDSPNLVSILFSQSLNINLPQNTIAQFSYGVEVNYENLQFGDLLFFNHCGKGKIKHVGIYLGDDLIVHAIPILGVTISSIKSNEYEKSIVGIKRITNRDIFELENINITNDEISTYTQTNYDLNKVYYFETESITTNPKNSIKQLSLSLFIEYRLTNEIINNLNSNEFLHYELKEDGDYFTRLKANINGIIIDETCKLTDKQIIADKKLLIRNIEKSLRNYLSKRHLKVQNIKCTTFLIQ